MLRQLQNVIGKNADATCVAGVNLKFGMLVEKDFTNKKAVLPQAGVKHVFFAVKERIATGIDVMRGELSDYEDMFENITKDEPVVLITPIKGERYALDHMPATGLAIGDKLKVKADGTLEKDATGTDAIAIYGGEYMDAGNHKLYIAEIL